MKRALVLAALAISAVAACTPAVEAPATPEPAPVAAVEAPVADPNALRGDGWGPLSIGMTKAEVIAAVGDTRSPNAATIPGECEEFRPERAPDGLWVMIQNGVLTRITIGDMSPLKTASGHGLGDAAAAIKAAYGDAATASPHKYQGPPAEYITVWDGGPRTDSYVQDETARGVVYEIDGTGHAGMIHVGGPSIQYVEGCA